MVRKETLQLRLEVKKKVLEAANAAYLALLSGQVQSYAIGSRNLTRLNLGELAETISTLEKEVDSLEAALLNGGKRRKAVAAVIRDF